MIGPRLPQQQRWSRARFEYPCQFQAPAKQRDSKSSAAQYNCRVVNAMAIIPHCYTNSGPVHSMRIVPKILLEASAALRSASCALCEAQRDGEYSHYCNRVVVEDCRYIFTGEFVRCVGDEQTCLANCTIANYHTPNHRKITVISEDFLCCHFEVFVWKVCWKIWNASDVGWERIHAIGKRARLILTQGRNLCVLFCGGRRAEGEAQNKVQSRRFWWPNAVFIVLGGLTLLLIQPYLNIFF